MLQQMLKSPTSVALLAGIASVFTFAVIAMLTGSIVNSIIISLLLLLNLSLLIIVVRFWVLPLQESTLPLQEQVSLEKRPSFSDATEAPTIELSLPPEHDNDRWLAPTAEQSSKPFTLGVADFEPPEPIVTSAEDAVDFYPPDQVAPSAFEEVTIARAYQKSTRPLHNKKDRMMQRFYFVCRVLKQMNLQVAVWTEGELNTLANNMLELDSEDKDMIAVLLPQNVVSLKTQRTLEYEFHAQLFNSLLSAAGQSIDIAQVTSKKDHKTGRCELTFQYQQHPVLWRFVEEGNKLSDKYLAKACQWVGKRCQGRFAVLEDAGFRISLVFIPHALERRLAQVSIGQF